jgi:hypothetical protein
MNKFKTTITFAHRSDNNQYCLEDDYIKINCPELKKWWEAGKCFGLVNSRKTIHLFENHGDAVSICGVTCKNHADEPSFIVMGGRKYTVCLKCRKNAEESWNN